MKTAPLMKAAMIAVKNCLAVKPEETALVVTDTGKYDIALAFFSALHAVGADATLTIMTPRQYNGQEPPRDIAAAMKASDVVFIPTTRSLSHTKARMASSKAGARIASMPGITEDMMTVGGMTADYRKVSELSWKLTELLDKAKKVEITTAAGTNLVMSLEGRKPGTPPDDGLYNEAGRWGNLPAGEAYIAPVEESVEGIAVIDGSMSPIGSLKDPIRLRIEKGKAVAIEGGAEAAALRKLLEDIQDPNAYLVGELGIGTNEKARLIGNILEDEKVLKTVHIALGMNVDMGGKIDSKTHNDGIILNPTVKFDNRTVLEQGEIVI
ncbi:MAG: aminopeptidase [Desulfatiglandales bacterium]